jgi:hypothetical protein
MEEDTVDCASDLSNKDEMLRDSSRFLGNCPANIRSWEAFENSLSPHTALSDTSQGMQYEATECRLPTVEVSFCFVFCLQTVGKKAEV